MQYVYIINENGVVAPAAYTTFALAKAFLLEKHQEKIEEEKRQAEEEDYQLDSDTIDAGEEDNQGSGKTVLWIESYKINITILKLPVLRPLNISNRHLLTKN